MGFDIECIIGIHSYPGEYFCPVCRTLVYPNEAFKAQCTHLYCKPCLAHIANGTKACPYDGYLVTESDSKPLAECDKGLAEKVGKVKVHCLYFRSGCTWEGTLSDCSSHCAGCSFGNSPVICNRCGVQIIHRQVHDHAQICPGGYDGQHAVAGVAGSTRSGTTLTTVTAQANHTVAQSGAPVPQPQNPQNVSVTQLPVQTANLLANVNSNVPVVTTAAMPAPDQWYQQQYQQYYQQYMGYDPYQQHQPFPIQQQAFQQYQQHPVQGQQSHAYSQPQGSQPHLQLQPSQQTNPAIQAAQLPHLQPQSQGQAQPLSQPQLQMMPQAQAQTPLPSQGQTQANVPVQALAPNYKVNPQQQPHPAMRPQTQAPLQALQPPPLGQSSQPPQFPHALGTRPPPQHPPMPQYQQGQGLMYHPQGQPQLQPPMHPQTQAYIQSSSKSNAQSQPQSQLYHPQPPFFHSQTIQTAAPASLPQTPHPAAPPVSGHHSYQQPQTAQKMQPGAPQQHAVLPHPTSGSHLPAQAFGQVPQQPTPMRPPHSHGLTLRSQAPGGPLEPQQHFLPHGQQPIQPVQHRPVTQPVQQGPPHNYAQQMQFSTPFQGQFHQQEHPPQQPLMHSQMPMRPSGPPQPQQSQTYVGIPKMPSQLIPAQSLPLSSGGFGTLSHSQPAQGDSESNKNQNYAKSSLPEESDVKDIKSPAKLLSEKGFEGDSVKEIGLNGTLVKDDAKDGFVKSFIKQEKSDLMGPREQANEGKSFGAGGVENEAHTEEVRTLSGSVPLKQADPENLMKPSKTVGPSTFCDETLSANIVSSAEGHTLPPRTHDSKHAARPGEVAMSNDQMLGSGEWRPLTKLHSVESNISRMNGGATHDPSMFGTINENLKPSSKDHFGRESTRTFDQDAVSRSLDKPLDGLSCYAVSQLDIVGAGPHSRVLPHHSSGSHGDMSGPGPEFVHHNIKPFQYHNPGGDYLGSPSRGFGGPPSFPRGTSGFEDFNSREGHRFGEGSRSFKPSLNMVIDPLRDSRFPPLPGHLRRVDTDDPGNPRFGGHRNPGLLHKQIGFENAFGPDGPGHLMKGKFSGPGYLSGHFNMGEAAGPGRAGEGTGNFPHPPFSESARGDMPSFLHHGEQHIRNNYLYHGMPNAAHFSGGLDSFDQSRKRKPVSNGWCRICEFDCETVERLEMHSQTREHQNMAMDMVKRIKLQNRSKQRIAGHMVHEGGSRARKVGMVGHGNKP